MTTRNRPLSPHLQVYRLPLLALMSITHRVTGCGLTAGLFVLAIWLGAAAFGPVTFNQMQALLAHPIGYLCLFGWTVCLFFHLCHGVRHLIWDTGWTLGKAESYTTGYIALAVTVVLSVLVWLVALI